MAVNLGLIASQISGHLSTSSFESISTITLSSNSSTIEFTSIPSTYKHLEIRGLSNGQDNTNIRLRFNGDTGSNYSSHGIQSGIGYGSGVYTNSAPGQTSLMMFDQQYASSVHYNATICTILDYTSTSKNKTIRTRSGIDNNSTGFIYFQSGMWHGTPQAITTITMYPVSNNFYAGSTFSLYGIKG